MAKRKSLLLAALLVAAPGVMAFSLLGPFAGWQVQGIAYQFAEDIGGPMTLNEGFRWNVPTLTYAFDQTFIDYFGPEGVRAVEEAMQILKDLPAANKLSGDLSEYSTSTSRENFEAQTLGLLDVKSAALNLMLEELGLADPVRYTFTLRGREVVTRGGVMFTNYVTVLRNYDPVTLQPSHYVNGTLYTYSIQEFMTPFQHADAIELVTDASLEDTPVVTGGPSSGTSGPNGTHGFGVFRSGLSRDDVGGLKFLYHPRNYAGESLLTGVFRGSKLDNTFAAYTTATNGAPTFTNILFLTNTLAQATNLVDIGLRGGKNKLHFQRVFFDAVLGQSFQPITNAYTDVVVGTNAVMVVQPLLRPITQPDIVFVAADLGLNQNPISPVLSRRTDTTPWIDNDAINGSDPVDGNSIGPGVITAPITITFSDQLPAFLNSTGSFLDDVNEDSSTVTGAWGFFDGSTNAPIVFSQTGLLSVQQLRNQILNPPPR